MTTPQWVGVGLWVLGIVLYFADLDLDFDIPGVDFPGIAGGICIVVGTFLFFDDIRIGAGVLVVAALFVGARLAVRYRITRFARYRTQTERLLGQTGYSTTPLDPRGSVQVASELWSAVSDSGEHIEKGTEVMVGDVDGLTLKVFKTGDAGE